MSNRFLLVWAKWLAAVIVYLALSAAVSLCYVVLMKYWKYRDDDSPAIGIIMIIASVVSFLLSLLWGVAYASALASPRRFASVRIVWLHFGLSQILGLLSFTILWCFLGTPLPDSERAASALIVFVFGLSVICFLLAIFVRVHLGYRKQRPARASAAETTGHASTAS